MEHSRNRIFVIGTGRSGTCWMGNILAEHEEINGYIEYKSLFKLVMDMTLDNIDRTDKIFNICDKLYDESYPKHVSHKTHQCIWIAEKIAERYKNALFVGMMRDVKSTVASMLQHVAVRRWCEEWHKYQIPNRFLGITTDNIDWYRNASIIERCTARWVSHQNELMKLRNKINMKIIQYEDLVKDTANILSDLQKFLNLNVEFKDVIPQKSSLTKWKSQLSARDVNCIYKTLKVLDYA